MTDMKDIKATSDADLATFIAEKREAVRKFRFALAGSRPRNVRQVRADKRAIAQALTEQTTRARATQGENK